jgi:hypothetical protein
LVEDTIPPGMVSSLSADSPPFDPSRGVAGGYYPSPPVAAPWSSPATATSSPQR